MPSEPSEEKIAARDTAPHFADSLMARVRELGHPLCAGLDPHLGLIPPLFTRGSMQPGDPETAAAVESFSLAVLDRFAGRAAALKPQIAFFEQLGSAGVGVLERVVARARELGLPLLLDAKRGDIGSTAEAYASAYLEPASPCAVDALTVNPYMGLDTLEPFAARAERYGRGLFVLLKTSNKGSGDVQDLVLRPGPGDAEEQPVFEAVARSLAELTDRLQGPATGWSSLGAVVGATYPEQAERARELMPKSLFLVPGYGAQGGAATEAIRSFVPGPNGREGGIVNSSRGLLFPDAASGATSVGQWERAIDDAVDRTTNELGEAVAR